MHRFDTPVPPRLSIELRAGTVAVDTADVDRDHRRARPRSTTRRRPPRRSLPRSSSSTATTSWSTSPSAALVRRSLAARSRSGSPPRTNRRCGQVRLRRRDRDRPLRRDHDRHRQWRRRLGIDRRIGARQHGQRRRAHRARRQGRGRARPARATCVLGTVARRGLAHERIRRPRAGRTAGGPLVAKTGSGNVIDRRRRRRTCGSRRRRATSRIDAVDEGEVRVKAASGDIQAGRPRRQRGLARRAHRQRPRHQRPRLGRRAGARRAPVRLQLSTVSGDIDLDRV